MPGRRYKSDRHRTLTDRPADDHGLKGIIDKSIQTLLGEISQGKSQHLLDYLAFAARFHRYSLHNQLLIYAQCPHATYVAGYRTWQQLGYQVAKGEKGIRILAPHSYVREDEQTGEETRAVYFVSVAAFDASQLANLDERPLPDFFRPLGDDQQGLCGRLEEAIRADGIAIRESRYTERAQGFSAHGEIVLKAGLDSRNRFLVLVHEYAHELLHWQDGQRLPQGVKECHAEAVSYVVAARFGLHNPFSSDYLQSWGTTPADLLAELDVVRATAAHIIEAIGREVAVHHHAAGEAPQPEARAPESGHGLE